VSVTAVLLVASLALGAATEEVRHKIIVYGESPADKAKRELVQRLDDLGYERALVRGDKTIIRHPDPWKGQFVLHEAGWMELRRQPIQVEGREVSWAKRNAPLAWAGCVLWPHACVRVGGVAVSRRKFHGLKGRVLEHAQPLATAWGDAVADEVFEQKLVVLSGQLEALWQDGTPLVSGAALHTAHQRKAELLAYWDSRTDDRWGAQLRAAVRSFILGVVQTGDHRFTEAELLKFDIAASSSGS